MTLQQLNAAIAALDGDHRDAWFAIVFLHSGHQVRGAIWEPKDGLVRVDELREQEEYPVYISIEAIDAITRVDC